MTLLTLKEVKSNLTTVDFSKLPKPTKKNKGYRGQLLELAVGIENSSNLCDMVDGELKSFTRGQSIAVTQLNHALPEIEKNVPFKDTVVGKKLDNTLYVSFSKENEYLSSKEISSKNDPEHFSKLEQDYNDIKDIIRNAIKERKELKAWEERLNKESNKIKLNEDELRNREKDIRLKEEKQKTEAERLTKKDEELILVTKELR